jgi:DNA (cytosine-5)-methyltransferase 1
VNGGRHPQNLTVGSLCTGYGGLDLAVHAVLGGTLAWYAETDRHAQTVLTHRFPGVGNLGDIRTVEWATVTPVDVLTAGFPCQDYPE